MSNIFVVRACTAGKGRQGRFICGAKRSWSDLQRRIFCPTKITLYTVFPLYSIQECAYTIYNAVNFEPHPVTGCLCAEKQRRQWESKASRQPKLDLYHTYILYIYTVHILQFILQHLSLSRTGTEKIQVHLIDPSPPHLCLAHILLAWSNKVKASYLMHR